MVIGSQPSIPRFSLWGRLSLPRSHHPLPPHHIPSCSSKAAARPTNPGLSSSSSPPQSFRLCLTDLPRITDLCLSSSAASAVVILHPLSNYIGAPSPAAIPSHIRLSHLTPSYRRHSRSMTRRQSVRRRSLSPHRLSLPPSSAACQSYSPGPSAAATFRSRDHRPPLSGPPPSAPQTTALRLLYHRSPLTGPSPSTSVTTALRSPGPLPSTPGPRPFAPGTTVLRCWDHCSAPSGPVPSAPGTNGLLSRDQRLERRKCQVSSLGGIQTGDRSETEACVAIHDGC